MLGHQAEEPVFGLGHHLGHLFGQKDLCGKEDF
jgi:hypothetical protein